MAAVTKPDKMPGGARGLVRLFFLPGPRRWRLGQFGAAADISAVSTGSQVMQTVTVVITGLAMGVTVLLGQ